MIYVKDSSTGLHIKNSKFSLVVFTVTFKTKRLLHHHFIDFFLFKMVRYFSVNSTIGTIEKKHYNVKTLYEKLLYRES